MQSLRLQYAQLQYYLREKLWRHAETLCTEVVSQNDNHVFRMWHAFCLDQQNLVADALREYKSCEGKREVHAAALTGLAVIYRRNKDTEGENQIATRLSEDRGTNLGAWLQAACVLWHSGDLTRARDVINKVLDSDAEYRDEYTSVQLIRGWIDLSTGRGAYLEKCLSMFEKVIQAESDGHNIDVDAAMGKIAYLERKAQCWPAQELQNKLIVLQPNFFPAYIVKAKQLMKTEDWDQSAEVIQRVLTKDPHHIEALILRVLHSLVRESKQGIVAATITTLFTALQQREPRNAYLYHACAQCFARLSGGSSQILAVTSQLAQYAVQLMPNSSEYQCDVAYQMMLTGDYRGAHAIYKRASGFGDGNTVPLLGLIKCTIFVGKLEDAAQQIDFLHEIQNPQSRNAELLFLHAMVIWRKNKNQAESIEKLDQAVEAHRAEIASQPTGIELYVKLNPPLVIEIAREYMQHCRTEPPEPGTNKTDPNAEKARRVLDMIIRHVPGSTEAQLLASKIAFIGGDIERAASMINSCITQDSTNSEAFLLQAQIAQYTGQTASAKQALEQALALDFEVKDQPQYNLLMGVIQLRTGELDAALQSLQTAMSTMEEVTNKNNNTGKAQQGASATPATKAQQLSKVVPLGVQDYVSLYLQLAQCYTKMRRMTEAKETIQKAAATFRDTPQMGRVSIAQAVITAQHDVDNALEILRSVSPTSEFYVAAKAKMANIYLTHRHNRRMFARCFEELVESYPSVQSLIHLGEAYSATQEPEKAITAFEKARAMDPNNTDLAVRIGRTLAATHDYQRALRYYREAVAGDDTKFSLRQDLALLYWRLGEIERAINTLKESPVMQNTKNVNQEEVSQSVERVNIALLMCKIYRSSPDMQQQAAEALIQARVFQNTLVGRLRNEPSEVIYQQRHIAATICCELGETYLKTQQTDKALTFYNEALKHEETNGRAMLALAKLYLSKGEVDGCEHQCNALLRINPGCEDAIIILADLMFRRNRYEDAAQLFLQLLEKKPDNYNAMAQYVQLLRRAGQLSNAPAVFANAEKLLRPGQPPDPGLCYSKGLYQRYTNNSSEALKELNQGRFPKDNPWSQRCLVAMVEIFILPDNENLWEDAGEQLKESVTENLKAAELLLQEIKDPYRRAVLEGYWLAAHKKKDYLDKSLEKFFEVLNDDEEQGEEEGAEDGTTDTKVNVPALVGMATALHLMKQTPKARNHLKRVAKANYNPAEDDDYERGWLLLADIYIQSGKYDLAQELLKRAVQANKSCSRGWEYMGLIYEKEQAYKDAAEYYEKAWKLLNERDPTIGFKLAFNFMKAKKLVSAIDVCHKVLSIHPNYPKIQKEVLERARLLLRQ